MTEQEQSEKIVYGSLITSTKCYKCIHFPLCFAQKSSMNLELASEKDCCYYQLKPPIDSVVLSREEYEYELKRERKETAEKIYTKIKNSFLINSKNRYKLKIWIKEQFGVDIYE